ncbi:MAG: hypothetical protein KHZ68_05175 [Rothia mucilaginosa]|uniref:hypothetical protein n=1 Tax=Rothia mucilaginosa TaxID=43675 RepID=UPI0026EEA9CF|nr:hypothetical protein [Rothia mucilaginosa]MBS4941049.1 hypothetical protein [Rothia mucilaginosa]
MSNEPVQDTRSTADQAPAPLPYAGAIRWLGAAGAILALLCLLTGVAMLVMKWVGAAPPALMSQIPLVLLPVAFIALMAALILSVMRRNKA